MLLGPMLVGPLLVTLRVVEGDDVGHAAVTSGAGDVDAGVAPPTGGKRPNYPIESVDNVLRLILLVAEQKQLRVSDVSTELGTAVSTAHRLLAMLCHRGFAVQDPDTKVYKAGPVLLQLGLRVAHNLDLRTLVRPFAEDLRNETSETVHVAVLEGDEMLFVDCVESPNALRVASRVGTRMWAHCTSVGKAWLACLPDDAVRALYPSPKLPGLTAHSISARSSLLAALGETRRQGYATNQSESEIGVGSVSTAIRDQAGKPLVSISVSLPLARLSDDRLPDLADAVLRTRDAVEANLR